ncbi:hypothetical protein AK95_06345 [Paenibacillus sp. LC231]|nr:hypothetical protein AK95_06345 [Paenibacillus sp. LC231]
MFVNSQRPWTISISPKLCAARLGMQGLAAKGCSFFHQIFIFLSLKEWESLGVPLDSYNPLSTYDCFRSKRFQAGKIAAFLGERSSFPQNIDFHFDL